MMQIAARSRITRAQEAVTKSVLAPVGGWNDRDPIGEQDPKYAVILDNMFCLPSKVILRKGCVAWATGMGSQVESIMSYRPSTGTPALFSAAGTNFYNTTASGAVSNNYLNMPGGAGNYASTPDSAALDILGDIDLIFRAQFTDWTPVAAGAIVAKCITGTNQVSYVAIIQSNGRLLLQTSPDGTAGAIVSGTSTVAPSFNDGSTYWLRITLDVNDGAGNRVYKFYTAADQETLPTAWTQLGATVTTAGVTTIFNSTSPLEVGSLNSGTVDNFAGRVYGAYLYNGIGGVLVASMVPTNTGVGSSAWVSALTAETWTVNGTVTVAGNIVQTGLTNARWQYVNMATSGGNFLLAVNGADKLRGWNGAAWWTDGDGTHDITGIDTSTCIDINLFKRRIWLLKNNSTSIYYGPVDSIAGAFVQLDFGSIFTRGGRLVKMVNWSLDAGIGIDDYAAFISSQGEVALYKGSDPSSATTWALVGVFYIGSPAGQRCAVQYGKDVLLVGQDGMEPLSIAILTGRLLTNVALTDKILNSVSTATSLYFSSFGWQIVPFPGMNMILLNVPIGVGQQQQYVMNTISGAWSRFKGWPANCFEVFGDELYFGGSGSTFKAWQTQADAGANINAEALQAFNYFGSMDGLKEFTMVRPSIGLTSSVGVKMIVNTDFDQTPPTGVPTFVSSNAGLWGSALWGSGLWGGNPVVQKAWQSATGVGYCGAIHMTIATNSGQLEWAATDYAFKRGGIL